MSMLVPPDTSTRLVTQNLLVSAAAAAVPERYVDEENVEGLATVISLSCLYDRLVVVGPQHLLDFDNPFLDYLRASVVEAREATDAQWKRAVASAERYAGAFLGVGRLRHASDIFDRIYRMSRRYGIDKSDLSPDGGEDVDVGTHLLAEVRSVEDLRQQLADTDDWVIVAYVLRTFLYIAFSDHMGMPIAFDAGRQPLVSRIADDSQERVREAIMKVITEGLRTDTSLRRPLRRLASPFAAIVFNEASNREGILERLKTLRDEQLDLRLRLRPLEEKLETSTSTERDDVQARIAAALEALARRYSVKTSQDLTVRRVVAAAKPMAAILSLNFVDAVDAVAEPALARDAESTLVELHALKRRLPSTAEQDADIRRLFEL